MLKIGTCVAVGGFLVGTIVAQGAHAAPQIKGPAPAATPTIAVNPAALAVASVTAETLPVTTKCGDSQKVRVKLVNKTTKPWNGVINFVVPPATDTPVSLGAAGDEATKTVEVVGAKLDCKKPLTNLGIRVFPQGAPSNTILVKALKAKSIKGDQSFPQPAPGETKIWLRRASVSATCGGQVIANVTLHAFGSGAPQEGKTKLGFGQYVSDVTVQVPPNAPTQAGMPVPTPLDCQAGAGIPAFDYALLTGLPKSGKLEAQEVTYE